MCIIQLDKNIIIILLYINHNCMFQEATIAFKKKDINIHYVETMQPRKF